MQTEIWQLSLHLLPSVGLNGRQNLVLNKSGHSLIACWNRTEWKIKSEPFCAVHKTQKQYLRTRIPSKHILYTAAKLLKYAWNLRAVHTERILDSSPWQYVAEVVKRETIKISAWGNHTSYNCQQQVVGHSCHLTTHAGRQQGNAAYEQEILKSGPEQLTGNPTGQKL